MTFQEIIEWANTLEGAKAVELDCSTLEVLDAVREMCEKNTCGKYGTTWMCPPNCGDIPSCREKIAKYHHGFIFQTVGYVEDSLDYENIMIIGANHKKSLAELDKVISAEYPDALILGSGECKVCPKCAYPDPCRFPDKAQSSMEAYGLLVNDICTKNGVPYYYGSDHMAFTGCVLVD